MKRHERVRAFVRTIWDWYSTNKRSLPWRDLPDTDPTERAYKVLVSEIMLQQTQVPRVIVTYKNFLERFPTLRYLAAASNADVLRAWRGMGYNSRALRLRDAAKEIMVRSAHHDIGFPTSMDDLMDIPGIGHYTAAAIRNFAFNIPTPCIDTNIRRILHRTFVGPENSDGNWNKDDEYLLGIAGEVLTFAMQISLAPTASSARSSLSRFEKSAWLSSSAEWHAALMDYGSLVQTKRNPKWDICPLTKKGIMKTTPLRAARFAGQAKKKTLKKEPGRRVGSTFIPNRIFRGRVVDALRDAPRGLTLEDIGSRVALDWNPEAHREWLDGILAQLAREAMVRPQRGRYVLG